MRQRAPEEDQDGGHGTSVQAWAHGGDTGGSDRAAARDTSRPAAPALSGVGAVTTCRVRTQPCSAIPRYHWESQDRRAA
ncbi:hypothetical protein [Streptomyces canus]|uniref:hypothetical protein n=1 Tax=Streptomyces canus TaxID=58343 RepID=UPI0037101262